MILLQFKPVSANFFLKCSGEMGYLILAMPNIDLDNQYGY